MSDTYITAFETAFESWLLSTAFKIGGKKQIENVFHGNFDAPKDTKRMPFIEYDITDDSANNLTKNTDLISMTIKLRVWVAGALNNTTKNLVKDMAVKIGNEFKKSSLINTYGIADTITVKRDYDPLVLTMCVGFEITINCEGSNAI